MITTLQMKLPDGYKRDEVVEKNFTTSWENVEGIISTTPYPLSPVSVRRFLDAIFNFLNMAKDYQAIADLKHNACQALSKLKIKDLDSTVLIGEPSARQFDRLSVEGPKGVFQELVVLWPIMTMRDFDDLTLLSRKWRSPFADWLTGAYLLGTCMCLSSFSYRKLNRCDELVETILILNKSGRNLIPIIFETAKRMLYDPVFEAFLVNRRVEELEGTATKKKPKISKTPTARKPLDNSWQKLHPPDAKDFYLAFLEGSILDLSLALVSTGDAKSRKRVKSQALDGMIWVEMRIKKLWRIYFKNKMDYKEGYNKLKSLLPELKHFKKYPFGTTPLDELKEQP